MKRTLTAVLLLALSLPCLTGCAKTLRPESAAEPTRSAAMIVPDNAVYYLEQVTPDPQSAAELWSEVFGIRFDPPVPELGNALTATLPSGTILGIRAPMAEHEKPVTRTYLRVPDLDKAVAAAAERGAEIAIDRMEIPGRGHIGIIIHGGIEQGLWEVPAP